MPPIARTILSVENDLPIREMIVEIVESLGHRCLGAGNAREAIEVIQQNEIDLILLDIHMPGARLNSFATGVIKLRSSSFPGTSRRIY